MLGFPKRPTRQGCDQLLIEASRRLTSRLRKSDLAARLGGDEFAVVLMEGSTGPDNVAKKLQTLMNQPYSLGGIELLAGASIGIATFPKDGGELASLLAAADEAMYKAKARRKTAAKKT
ncbi:diguanylate cyclase domain-containing protein [Massilia eburnea]|nr:GGDEF domain-containing protein [Massilia eburnea]